eukprot:SM000826S22709  [mRNA]  locus=s826:328:1455:+ [translate_table: standard]
MSTRGLHPCKPELLHRHAPRPERAHLAHSDQFLAEPPVGPLPLWITELPALRFLDLRFNSFTGTLPPSLFRTSLDVLAVNDNSLMQQIPDSLRLLPVSLAVLARNTLSGPIPASIGQLAPTLSELVLLNNGLVGSLPPSIGQLRFTVVLNIAGNRLSPPSISNLTSLVQPPPPCTGLTLVLTILVALIVSCQLDISGKRIALFKNADKFFVGKPPPNTTVDVIIGKDCSSGRCQSFALPPPGEQS